MIKLETIVYNIFARNGNWCCSQYENHPHGCPNFKKGCTKTRPDFKEISNSYTWYAVIETFDLKAHAERMKIKHPHWTERQCRNPLYWQGTVRANLRNKTVVMQGDIVLDIPEACGINVFETMKKVGIILERKPDTVRKIMVVGKRLEKDDYYDSENYQALEYARGNRDPEDEE
jgi:hypothetical protein